MKEQSLLKLEAAYRRMNQVVLNLDEGVQQVADKANLLAYSAGQIEQTCGTNCKFIRRTKYWY